MRVAELLGRVRGATRGVVLLVLLMIGFATMLGSVLAPRRAALVHVGVPCDYAVEVDGVLRCGEGAPHSLAEVCPGHGARNVTAEFRSGDAVKSSGLCQLRSPAPGGPSWSRMLPTDLAALGLPVDLNSASIEELASLPGIGPVLAGRITEARPFADVAELRGVRGIGPRKMEKIRIRARTHQAERSQAERSRAGQS